MSLDTRPPAIFLLGPTASGKTDLAVELVEHLPCEIISVDSALVYRGMDIGTAKPDAATLAQAPHRLIDIRDPAETYSAGDFRRDALAAMQEITAAGRIPLLVGGTSLYFQRLLAGDSNLPAADTEVRKRLEGELQQQGCPALHQRLAQIDPESARRIAPTDPQRTLRALELWEVTGKTRTQLWQEQQAEPFPWRLMQLGLMPAERSVLHQRIELRFKKMLSEGLIEEVASLKARKDLHSGLPALRSVGYRQVWQHLDGELSWQEMFEKGVIATRQLAKRQLTWMRSWQDLHPLVAEDPNLRSSALEQVREFSLAAG
ncbi:tRNA dimethylallyltransferase [Marinospirillum celere]|uniref:tRNA dimethylallyltransferase n=1 Tax=Marinospirillum celere TaxID=1122252 RepID=A0A1I1ITB4_9GAMM|nr:tRNA (adenosine(37)-N6)-dimethylallyltransferase MiaA [Marinospirillum celere]SFC39151.1 tRNA dimethylallyltransferase [Marinospirillum celere]